MYFCFLFKPLLFVILVIYNLGCTSGTKRDLRCLVNPGLNATDVDETAFNLVHIKANSTEDTIHFLWSTYNLPSILIARTPNDAELLINFTKLSIFDKGALTFSIEPFESVGLTVTELWEFYDDKDHANVNKSSSVVPLNMERFLWTDVNQTLQCTDISVTTSLRSANDEPCFSRNGTFEIQLSIVGDEVSAEEFPHLIFTGNTTQIKVLLNNLLPNSSQTRFAVELMAFASPSSVNDTWQKDVSFSINDEFTPGVFKTVELSSPCKESHCKSFLSWRPVAYTGQKPIIANSSEATMSDYIETTIGIPHSIAEVYFDMKANSSVIGFNISFGTSKDGFYRKTNYTTWTLMVGTGHAVSLGLSITAIIFLTVGIGALIMFVLGGAVYTACQHCKKKDDDLLLSEGSIN